LHLGKSCKKKKERPKKGRRDTEGGERLGWTLIGGEVSKIAPGKKGTVGGGAYPLRHQELGGTKI